MSAHTRALDALRRVPVRKSGQSPDEYADVLRGTIPPQPMLQFSPMGQRAPPPNRAWLEFYLAARAADLLGAAAAMDEAFPETYPSAPTSLASNGQALETKRASSRAYMAEYRARKRAEKESA